MNNTVEKVLALLDDFRTNDEMTYSAYSALYDEISLLDDMLKEQPEIIKCKDCRYSGFCNTEDVHRCTNPDGWFCADGKRR